MDIHEHGEEGYGRSLLVELAYKRAVTLDPFVVMTI